jgi:hypothetical protein
MKTGKLVPDSTLADGRVGFGIAGRDLAELSTLCDQLVREGYLECRVVPSESYGSADVEIVCRMPNKTSPSVDAKE